MQEAPLPYNEAERLAALRKYRILDTVADKVFQMLVEQAAAYCDTPVTLINLIDSERGWFFAKTGIDEIQAPRSATFCAHAILQRNIFVVPDTRTDTRFSDNPFVLREPAVRFYAGVPLITQDGHAIGTLCVMDFKPRLLDQGQMLALKKLRDEVIEQLEFFHNFDQLLLHHHHHLFLELSPDALIISNTLGHIVYVNRMTEKLFGYERMEMIGEEIEMLLPEELREQHARYRQYYVANPKPRPMGAMRMDLPARRKDGSSFLTEICLSPVVMDGNKLLVVSAIRDVSERTRNYQALTRISQETFSRTGEDFFIILAKLMANELQADYVTIGKFTGDGTWIETVAVIDHGNIGKNFCYDLAPTPCATVVRDTVCNVPEHLQEQYPDDPFFRKYNLHAYVGVRLFDSQGETCGVINAIYHLPLPPERARRAEFLLQLFALRAASELERKEIVDTLRNSEHSFRQLFDNSPLGMLMLDRQGKILQANQATIAIFGYTRDDLRGRDATILNHPDDQAAARAFIEKLITGDSNSPRTELCRRADGGVIHVNVYGYPIHDMQNRFQCIVLHIEDITVQKRAEEDIRMLSLAVEHSPNACLITDGDVCIEYVNPQFTHVTGYSPEEVIGRKPGMLASGETPREVYDGLWETILSGREWRGELYNRRKNGEFYWARQVIFPISDDSGRIRHFVSFHEDNTRARHYAEKLTYQATHDQLTGLINRYEFERRLDHTIKTARADGSEHAMCFLDLDQFKVINDTSGHVAGDALLRRLGGLLRRKIRQQDTIGRLGGDEFGILMEHCPLEKARDIACMLCAELAGFIFVWENKSHSIGVSIGIAAIDQDTRDTIEVLKQVDTACYAAKDSGRNRVHVYNEDERILSRRLHETNWVPEINAALNEDRFELMVQPIMRLDTGEAKNSYEVLIRLKDPGGNIILPGVFLPSAERYNLSMRIDRWVIDRVFQWLMKHPARAANIDSFAINLSGASITDRDLLRQIVELFETSGLSPSKIRFELTETSAVANMLEARNFMEKLTHIGLQISLDDFGSGLSSFAYLKHLPVNILKIDGMFVKDIAHDKSDYAIVSMINELAHALGMLTVAEYVESEAILECLKKIGVDYAQGYAIAEPMAIDRLL